MPRSKSSKKWLHEHFTDPYVKKSKEAGYRSRAAYKLLAIQEKDKILASGMKVIDLGASPGGWSQVAKQLVGTNGQVYAVDILPMEPITGVIFIQGDFREQAILDSLLKDLAGSKADVIISDMAPNTSGNRTVDQSRMMYLAELALETVQLILKPGGHFVSKVFQGPDFDAFLQKIKRLFKQVRVRKPEASRARSTEVYIVAKLYNG